MANPFVHMELNTVDLAKAKAFYSAMFGWEFHDMPMAPGMTYSTFKPDTAPGGGMMSMPDGYQGWLPYIGVDEIHAATAKAASLGAAVCIDSQEIPNVGWWSLLADPTGATIAIFQPKPA